MLKLGERGRKKRVRVDVRGGYSLNFLGSGEKRLGMS